MYQIPPFPLSLVRDFLLPFPGIDASLSGSVHVRMFLGPGTIGAPVVAIATEQGGMGPYARTFSNRIGQALAALEGWPQPFTFILHDPQVLGVTKFWQIALHDDPNRPDGQETPLTQQDVEALIGQPLV